MLLPDCKEPQILFLRCGVFEFTCSVLSLHINMLLLKTKWYVIQVQVIWLIVPYFNTFKSSIHWFYFIVLLKAVKKATNYFLSTSEAWRTTSEAWRTISVAIEGNISSYKRNNGDFSNFYLLKGRLKLFSAVLKLLLMYIFMQLPQCCILNELLDTEFIIQVSFLLS